MEREIEYCRTEFGRILTSPYGVVAPADTHELASQQEAAAC